MKPKWCLLPPRGSDGKTDKRTMAYARMFADDIEDFLKLNFFHCYSFEKFFEASAFEDLVQREVLPLEVARKAAYDEEAHEILDKLLMMEDDQKLWKQIHFPDVPKSSSFEVFSSRFLIPSGNFFVLDRVAAVLDVEPILDHVCAGSKYPSLRAAVTDGPQQQMKMARRFLRELPRLAGDGGQWFWPMIAACAQDAHNISTTLPYLLPNWQTELAAHRSSLASSSFSFESMTRVLMAGVSCRPPAEFEPFRDQMTVPGTSIMPTLRKYQKELVERTDRGENTIVCAPTGSGKTVVGAHVALHHLRTRAKQGKPARVVMIVPKVFLVEQQAALFNSYAKKEFYVAKLSGESSETGEPQLIKFLSGDIVVLTPQILVNMLQQDSETARLYIADVSLLLLDECHHTDKKNPYNVIMQTVKEAKHARPQVVGLTASLGVGDGGGITVEGQAFNHIVRMCVRMAADSITTVMRNREELASFVQLPEDVIRRVMPMLPDVRRFHSHLITAINFVSRHLYVEFDALLRERPASIDPNKLARFPPLEKTEDFTQAVVNVDTELRKLTDGERKWRLKRGIDFVQMYHKTMLLNDLLPAAYAFEQLSADVDELDAMAGRQCAFLDYFRKEQAEFAQRTSAENDKEILQELRKELAGQFRADSSSRVLIFCLRRETAQLLTKYLNEQRIEAMGRAEVLTSTNAASVRNGQSPSEQRAVIEAFTRGACKVIVSTSVAEEGLDVAACNLIVKYNTTGNVIQLVQQRGRARASNSRSVLLALDERVYAKEYQNKMAETIMIRTVEKIYAMGDGAFGEALMMERAVQAKQAAADEKEAEKRSAKKYKELILLCEKCNSLICSSNHLRLFSAHFIAVDSAIWRRMRVQAKKGAMIDDNYKEAGVLKCTCEKEIGRVVKIQGQFVPTLKADSILFRHETTGEMLSKYKKWKGIAANLLEIREGTVLEATAMNRALQSSNANLSRALESLCLL